MGNQQGKNTPEGPTLGGKKKSFFQDVGDALEKTGEGVKDGVKDAFDTTRRASTAATQGVKDAFDFTGGAATSCGSQDTRGDERGRGMSGSTRALLAAYESDPAFRAKANRMTARHSTFVSTDKKDGDDDGGAAASSSSSSSASSSTPSSSKKVAIKRELSAKGRALLGGFNVPEEERGSLITGGMGGGEERRRASRRPAYQGDPAALFDACRKVSDVWR